MTRRARGKAPGLDLRSEPVIAIGASTGGVGALQEVLGALRTYEGAELGIRREQISTAGLEASGTGNMKLSMNGALTIGTLDGANIEIRERVGADHFFLFGLTADQVAARRQHYNPWDAYRASPLLRGAIDLIRSGFFSYDDPKRFTPLLDSLLPPAAEAGIENLTHRGQPLGDEYFVLADFDDYVACKGEQGAKEAGKMRAEGKEYVVKDGDVLNFLFNV